MKKTTKQIEAETLKALGGNKRRADAILKGSPKSFHKAIFADLAEKSGEPECPFCKKAHKECKCL